MKTIDLDFGQFVFLDDHAVIAAANEGANIGPGHAQKAVEMIEEKLPGDYALILDRKADYSVMPLEVYRYFDSLKRLKAIAIVKYKDRDFLPNDMESLLYSGMIKKFDSIEDAHHWVKALFNQAC